MDNSNYKDSKSYNRSSENELVRAYVSSLIATTINIDKFTSWLLAVVGAIFSITIANLKSISDYISINSLKISLFFLTLSFACGGIQKILSLLVSIDFEEERQLRERFKDFKNTGHGDNIASDKTITSKAIARFKNLHPCYIRKFMGRKNGNIDVSLKRRVYRYYLQLLFVLVSVLLFFIFMLNILCNIKTT